MRTKAALRNRPKPRLSPRATPTRAAIAARAYQLHRERRIQHSHKIEAWLSAEQESQQELDGERMATAP